MNRMKKGIAALLLVCLMLAAVTPYASAETIVASGQCSETVSWTLDSEGTLRIFGEGPMDKVPWKNYSESIRNAVIENGITSIAGGAFSGCMNLETATIPESITAFDLGVFHKCYRLKTVNYNAASIAKSVDGAYVNGTLIEAGDGAGAYSGGVELIIGSSVRSIPARFLYVFGYGGVGAVHSVSSNISSVIFEEGIERIGDWAFTIYGAKVIRLPKSLRYIGDHAFDGERLSEICIPENVETIGVFAFGSLYCPNLNHISVAEANAYFSVDEHGVLFNKEKTELILCPRSYSGDYVIPKTVTTIDVGAFSNCSALTRVTIPASTTSIGSSSFSNCSALTEVAMPDSVKNIGYAAFSGCTSLRGISIPSGITNIESFTFGNCSSLTTVTIPENVTAMASDAFDGCTSLAAIWVDANNPAYSSDGSGVVFSKDQAKLIRCPEGFSGAYTVPSGVASIEDGAFSSCTDLTSISIPESVTSIGRYAFGDYAFEACTGLTGIWVDEKNKSYSSDAVGVLYNKEKTQLLKAPAGAKLGNYTIPDSVTDIGSRAFSGCTGRTSITIPESITSIGYCAFSGFTGLTSIVIPESVTSISYYAFEDCTDLTNIIIPKSVTYIGDFAFKGCAGLMNIIIPKSVTYIGAFAFNGCAGLTSITIPEGIESIYPRTFSGCTALTSITIPEGVTSIGPRTFENCTALTSITIPESVTDIGTYAFIGCSGLTSITIPNSIGHINPYVFSGCSGLTSFTIPESVMNIGYRTFENCTALTSITIPAGVTSIDDAAFDGCSSMTSVIISENVTSLGITAFANCDTLASVCFKGDAPETCWETFKTYDKAAAEFHLNPDLKLYYIDGKEGWTTPKWNGYPTATWDGVNVPHTHKYQSVVTAPTCTEKGYTTYTCTICKDSYVAEEVPALGHAWDEGKVTVAPTSEKEGVKTFTCTRCGATQEEVIAKLPSVTSFTDVDAGAYYANAVSWAVANNVTNGTSTSTFSPEATCTRGQIVTFLWRAAGEPAPTGTVNPFTDVDASAYYYKAVLWAVENGITAGTSATTFSPDEGCTRGQVATFLWRYESMPDNTTRNPFTDVRTSAYYYGAVLWAVENGITNGTSATTFEPEATCTRGQIVTFLYRDIAG